MPILIQEVVIRTTIIEQPSVDDSRENFPSENRPTVTYENCIAQAVERVLEILKTKNER